MAFIKGHGQYFFLIGIYLLYNIVQQIELTSCIHIPSHWDLPPTHPIPPILCHSHGQYFRPDNKGKPGNVPTSQELTIKDCHVSAFRYVENSSEGKWYIKPRNASERNEFMRGDHKQGAGIQSLFPMMFAMEEWLQKKCYAMSFMGRMISGGV